MSSILRKVKSLPTLIKKQKSSQKLEKLCDSTPLPYKEPPSRPRNWLFLERCHLLEALADYFIAIHGEEDEDRKGRGQVWYWGNDIDEQYPMTYQLDATSMVSDSLLHSQRLDSPSEMALTNDQQVTLTRHFRAYRPPQRL